ncbi:MAG: hypothetical protein FWH29_07470 [Methanobrevibacter sp.]|nr:hypothetical protein [Methanobrevibacter sp.]
MNNIRKISITNIFMLLLLLLLVFSLQTSFAADVHINSVDIGGINGTLAIANDTDTIVLASGTYNKYNEDFNLTIAKNLTIRGNGPIGTVIIDGGNQSKLFTISSNLNVTFINIVFTNGNQIQYDTGTTNQGGAIYAEDTRINFINCTFTNNTASNFGGAICGVRSVISVLDSNFGNNTVTYHSGTTSYGGGAIYLINSTLTVFDSNFINNTVANLGGAIYFSNSVVNIKNSNFINNSAIDFRGSSSGGGAIFNSISTSFNLTNSTFINNYVITRDGYGDSGGAIYNSGNFSSIVNTSFINNSASLGGGIFNNGINFSVVNSTFRANNAGGGAAIENRGSNVIVVNSTFTANNASAGAIYNTNTNFTVLSSTFTANIAVMGGAIYNTNGANFKVINSTFTDNDASMYGGAIYTVFARNFSVFNSTFYNNTATELGGAIHSTGVLSIVNVIDSTFIDNNAIYGGAICHDGENCTVVNSTFINNSAINGGGIFYSGYGLLIVNDSFFTNNTQAIGLGNTNYQLNNNTIKNNLIAIQFVLKNQEYTIPDLINPCTVVNIPNIIANNSYAIGISGTNSNYTLANSSYNTSGNINAVIFTGSASTSYYSDDAIANILVNSIIQDYSGVGVTFIRGSQNNTLFNCNITNNTDGIWINGTNNRVISCNILNNNLGIHVLSGSSFTTINYNRILNNTYFNGVDLLNNGNDTDANYNWWGNNVPAVNGINLANWFVIGLSANNFTRIVNTTTNPLVDNVELFYELLLIDSTGLISSVDYGFLPSFLVDLFWNSTNGTIHSLNNVDGKGKYSFNVSLTQDYRFALEAIGDNANIILYLDSTLRDPLPSDVVNITINKTSNATNNPSYGDLITYTIIVTNNGPDNATGVTVIDNLDPRLIFLNASSGAIWNGSTVIWTIGILNVGDTVTLNIIVRINGTGTIFNVAEIITNEDNIGENDTGENETYFDALKLETNSSIIVTPYSKIGNFVNINGTVLDEKGNPVANVNVTLLIDGSSYILTTNDNGFWTLLYLPSNTGNLSIVLTWIGNEIYVGFENSSSLNILKLKTYISIEDIPLRLNFTSNLLGHLYDENDNPIAGATVEFFVNGTYIGSNLTDTNGKVVLTYTPNNTGRFNISLEYKGNNIYESSNNSIILEVTIGDTKIINDTNSTKPVINTTISPTPNDELNNNYGSIDNSPFSTNIIFNGTNSSENHTDNSENDLDSSENDTWNENPNYDIFNPTYPDSHVSSKNKYISPISMLNTGNSIAILVLSLLSITCIGFWRKQKI